MWRMPCCFIEIGRSEPRIIILPCFYRSTGNAEVKLFHGREKRKAPTGRWGHAWAARSAGSPRAIQKEPNRCFPAYDYIQMQNARWFMKTGLVFWSKILASVFYCSCLPIYALNDTSVGNWSKSHFPRKHLRVSLIVFIFLEGVWCASSTSKVTFTWSR